MMTKEEKLAYFKENPPHRPKPRKSNPLADYLLGVAMADSYEKEGKEPPQYLNLPKRVQKEQ